METLYGCSKPMMDKNHHTSCKQNHICFLLFFVIFFFIWGRKMQKFFEPRCNENPAGPNQQNFSRQIHTIQFQVFHIFLDVHHIFYFVSFCQKKLFSWVLFFFFKTVFFKSNISLHCFGFLFPLFWTESAWNSSPTSKYPINLFFSSSFPSLLLAFVVRTHSQSITKLSVRHFY